MDCHYARKKMNIDIYGRRLDRYQRKLLQYWPSLADDYKMIRSKTSELHLELEDIVEEGITLRYKVGTDREKVSVIPPFHIKTCSCVKNGLFWVDNLDVTAMPVHRKIRRNSYPL